MLDRFSTFELQHPTAAPAPPKGQGWCHELKHDGYRMVIGAEGGRVRFRSRGGLDWVERFPELAREIAKFRVPVIMDGEVAVADEEGVTEIGLLEEALARGETSRVIFCAFDLLCEGERDRRLLPYLERKEALAALLRRSKVGGILYVDHMEGDGAALLAAAVERGAEGIVAKRIDAAYRAGRNRSWLKSKVSTEGLFPIVGFVGAGRIESLLVAEPGVLEPVGRVEFVQRIIGARNGAAALRSLAKGGRDKDGVVWVEPRLVARVRTFGRTRRGMLRHPVLVDVVVAG